VDATASSWRYSPHITFDVGLKVGGGSVRELFFFTANVASGVVGLLGRPLSGLLYEVTIGMVVMWLFDWGTFNPVAWFFVPVFGGALNAFLEILAIRLIWMHKFSRKNFLWLWLANIITIALATAWVVIDPPQL